MPHKIHSREYSREGGVGGSLHNRDSDGYWNVFNLKRNGSKLWLNTDYNANPQNRWNLSNRLVFRSRKSLHFSPVRLSADSGEFCFTS